MTLLDGPMVPEYTSVLLAIGDHRDGCPKFCMKARIHRWAKKMMKIKFYLFGIFPKQNTGPICIDLISCLSDAWSFSEGC